MPFQSEKQRRFLHANHPEIAKRWESEYANGGISNHFQRRPFKKGSYSRSYNPGAGGVVQHGPVKTKTHHNGGGNGPPSVVHKPKGPTAEEIAAAKARAEAEKRKREIEARQKHLKDFKKTQKKKTSWAKKNWEDIKAMGTVPYNFAKGIFGNIKNPGEVTQVTLTDAMKEDLINKAKAKGTLTGNIDYTAYNTPTKTFTGLNKFMDPMDIANALTMGGTNFKTDESGNIELTGGAYDFNKDNVITNFIDQGGMTGLAKKLGAEKIGEKIYDWTAAKGGVARKKYSTGTNGILDIDEESEDISLTAFNPKFDDVPELTEEKEEEKINLFSETEESDPLNNLLLAEDGVTTLFRAKNGGYAVQGGVKNYLGEQEMVHAPKHWQSAPDHPKTELTYITKPEKDLLVKADLHGSLHGSVNKGPEGLTSLNGWGDYGDFDGPSSVSSGGGNPNEDRAAEEAHANEFAGIDSGGWDPGVFSPGTTPTGGDVNHPNIGSSLHGGPEFKLTPFQKRDEINRIVTNKQTWDKDKWKRSLSTISKVPKPTGIPFIDIPRFGWFAIQENKKKNERIAQIEEDLARLEKLGYEPHPWEERGLKGYGIKGDLEFELFELNNPNWDKGPDEKDRDGPEVPKVAPVHEEIQDYTEMAWEPMSYLDQIRSKQALRASLQAKGIIQDNQVMLNSGGLANLFRVKNYN